MARFRYIPKNKCGDPFSFNLGGVSQVSISASSYVVDGNVGWQPAHAIGPRTLSNITTHIFMRLLSHTTTLHIRDILVFN